MYESPIQLYIEQAIQNIEEQRDNQICNYLTEKFDIQVNREELVKALKYDRAQYDVGYRDALQDYYDALTDYKFLMYNYGIQEPDEQFLHAFNPLDIVKDHKEWKRERDNECQRN